MEGKILVLFFLGFTVAFGHKYKPNWESLDSRPLPQVIFKYSKKGIKITLFEIFIFFLQKFKFDFPRKLSIFSFLGENVVVLAFSAVDNFDFTRKIAKKN